MAYNKVKNRNQNIVPSMLPLLLISQFLILILIQVNTNRVILSKKPGVDGSEYINATYLHVSVSMNE